MRRAPLAALGALLLGACGAGDADLAGAAPNGAASDSTADRGPLAFTDVTAASGLDMVLTSGRSPATQILEVKGGGLALFDFDKDGDLDVFVPNGATLDSPGRGPGARLFENVSSRGEPRFADATARAGVDFDRWGMGPAVGDVDGDGYDDVFVACFGRDALLANERGARLVERTDGSGLGCEAWGAAAAFGDLDQDGDLDLYLANYLRFDPRAPPPPDEFQGVPVFGGPAGLAPEPDVLYANRGDGTFEDATERSGVGAARPSYGLGVVLVDFDADGLLDAFVGNDSMRNFLFANRGGLAFDEVGLASGVASNGDGRDQATMGVAVADVDGDGRPDLFTTNFAADTNTLHANGGGLAFADRTSAFGLGLVSRPFLGWSASFADVDLDGDQDLAVWNGHVYPEAVTARLGVESRQRPLLFERVGARFRRVEPRPGTWLDEPRMDRGAAFADLDGDGDPDAVVAELSGPVRVLRNDRVGAGPGSAHWLSVELADRRTRNPRGLGARVEVQGAGGVQTRWIHASNGFQTASPPLAHFGLGDSARAVVVRVRWPDGELTSLADVAVDRRLVVERD